MQRLLNVLILLAVVLVIGGMSRYLFQERQREKFAGLAQIASAMAEVQGLKMRIRMYHINQGVMPDSNAALGLPEPENLKRGGAKSVSVEEGGVIHLIFAADNDQGLGHIFLAPDFADDYGDHRWVCFTPSYPDIERWMPLCNYRPL